MSLSPPDIISFRPPIKLNPLTIEEKKALYDFPISLSLKKDLMELCKQRPEIKQIANHIVQTGNLFDRIELYKQLPQEYKLWINEMIREDSEDVKHYQFLHYKNFITNLDEVLEKFKYTIM